jgi:hypothetical protein
MARLKKLCGVKLTGRPCLADRMTGLGAGASQGLVFMFPGRRIAVASRLHHGRIAAGPRRRRTPSLKESMLG